MGCGDRRQSNADRWFECQALPAHTLAMSKPTAHRPRAHRRAPARGFTIIELMIAVVVIGVIMALAFPSFQGSIRKSRRAEAFTALGAVQLAQERFRANNPEFTNRLSNARTATPPGLELPATTPSGYYTVSLSGSSATGYTALATAVAGTSQANDGDCGKLSVRMDVGNLLYGSAALAGTITESAAGNKCWVR